MRGARIAARTCRVGLAVACLLCGCVSARPPAAPPTGDAAQGTPPPTPFDDAPVSFFISGLRFGAAEVATVRLCVTPDGQVTGATLQESSGDDRFDELALIWARRVRLRKDTETGTRLPAPAAAHEMCGPVRVELHIGPKRGLSGPSEAVG